MANSLTDQLLKAGIINKGKAKKVKQEGNKQRRKKGLAQNSEVHKSTLAQMAEKAARDRLLNQQRNDRAQHRAVEAQIKQIILSSAIVRNKADIDYHFKDGAKICKILISAALKKSLVNGQLAIAQLGADYHVIPRRAAEKIIERDVSYILLLNDHVEEIDVDDPYADYKVPDDLIW